MANKRTGGVPHGSLTPSRPAFSITVVGSVVSWDWSLADPWEFNFDSSDDGVSWDIEVGYADGNVRSMDLAGFGPYIRAWAGDNLDNHLSQLSNVVLLT